MIILSIGIWVTAMFIVGYLVASKEVMEDKPDYYDRHGQPKLDEKETKQIRAVLCAMISD